MGELLGWIITRLMVALATVISLWMAGAIYYDLSSSARWGRWLAMGWVGGTLLLFVFWRPLWQPIALLLGILTLFLGWWLQQKPSHTRDWDPSVAVLPRAVREGDTITVEDVRNFDYRSQDEVLPRYETRTFHLTNLQAADIIFFHWGSPWISHPVLVFDFGADGRVCLSIEVRYRKGQSYSILRSFYRQQELIILVTDERDSILRRTKYGRNQKAYLYRFSAGVDEPRAVFLDYVEAINHLYEKPRWYHALCANCTTTFYQLPGRRCPCDWRVLANGQLDRALYEAGRLDHTLPFAELRRIAYLNEVANSAPEDGFGDYIRHELERRRHDR